MNNIALITTGGTIGATLSKKGLNVSDGGTYLNARINEVSKKEKVNIDIVSCFNKLSENLEPSDWIALVSCIKNAIDRDFDSIIVTHGTDTLCYSIAASSLIIGREIGNVRVCFTGSFLPPEHKDTDASINLVTALRCCLSKDIDPGFYVAFRTSEHNTQGAILSWLDTKPMVLDSVGFESLFRRKVGLYSFDNGLDLITQYTPTVAPSLPSRKVPQADAIQSAARRVKQLLIYPGMDFKAIDELASRTDVFILHTYHSGTAPSSETQESLISAINRNEEVKFILSAYPSELLENPYESTIGLVDSGAYLFRDLLPHVIYTFFVCGLAQSSSVEELLACLEPWRHAV